MVFSEDDFHSSISHVGLWCELPELIYLNRGQCSAPTEHSALRFYHVAAGQLGLRKQSKVRFGTSIGPAAALHSDPGRTGSESKSAG